MIEIKPEDHEQLITLADLKELVNEFSRQLQAAPPPVAGQDGAPSRDAETVTAQGDNS